ncbi:MAG: HEAT repeat domain-containing protein [bacterium]
MEKTLLMDLLKEIAVGFKSAKSYPPGHPMMDKVVSKTLAQLNKVLLDKPALSLYFLEQTIITQDERIDITKNLAVKSFLDTLRKIELSSLTFESGTSTEDLKNLYEVIGSSKIEISKFGSIADMLESKGTSKIKINAVQFGLHGGSATEIATPTKTVTTKSHTEVVEAIRQLKELVEQGVPGLKIQQGFVQAAEDITTTSEKQWPAYSEAVARILEQLPSEHRIELLRDMELKPFVLRLLSKMSDETLVNLITTKANEKESGDFKQIINGLGEDRFAEIMPLLKENIPNVYEYFAQVGLLLSEKISSTVSKDDLKATLQPYYAMLESQNASVREEGFKSLTVLANRFMKQGNDEVVGEIIQRFIIAIEKESVNQVVLATIDVLSNLYSTCAAQNHEQYCNSLLEPFSKILGRTGLPIKFKQQIIKFLGETKNPAVLPILFSFLWESGLYPDVRKAIVKFGRDAVNEGLQILKEAEDIALKSKLVDIMKNIGKESVEMLVENLGSNEWYIRRNIIAMLGDIGDKSVLPDVERLLADEDDRVRLELVRTFAKFDYYDGLKNALMDASLAVKTEALKGMKKKIKPQETKELLPLFNEKGDTLHMELLGIISRNKNPEAATFIADFLKTLVGRDDTVAQELKERGVMVLARLQTDEKHALLEELKMLKDKTLNHYVNEALKHI